MTGNDQQITQMAVAGGVDSVLLRSRAAGEWFAERVQNRHLQLRRTFIRRRPGKDGVPPLAVLMRGGQGGQVRLKLLLSLLWVGAKPPHDVTFPARTWAELIGLPQPEANGARRVREAIDWLATHKFIAAEEHQGLPTQLTLLREDGSGVAYTIPGVAATIARDRGRGLEAHRYVQLPASVWTMGWMAVLSPPALAALLILLAEQNGPTLRAIWLSPRAARDRYALSDQTRYKGLAQLEALQLVHKEKHTLARSSYEFKRIRNSYALALDRLEDSPLEIKA
jgi:hypothetical protein